MKRSRNIALVTMGVGSLMLGACEEEPLTQASIFRSVDQCVAGGEHTRDECEEAHAYAISEHDLASPRYSSLAECEAEMGEGRCEEGLYDRGRQSYRPGFAAFMFSRTGTVAPQPLYQSPRDKGKFRTADNTKVAGKTGKVGVPQSAAKRPKNKVHTASRGGFGGFGRRMSSRSSGG